MAETTPRNLVLCFDGTNNQFGPNNTNVIRTIQSLDRNPLANQRLYYGPGVGTLPESGYVTGIGKWLSKVRGLAFGAGLTTDVEEAYTFLMNVWEPGDRVYLFGFSRGSYTARVLAAMLHSMGLLPRQNAKMVRYVLNLFDSVKGATSEDSNYWKLCNQFRKTFARHITGESDNRRFPIHFLGLWDTVSSLGWIWNPKSFPFTAKTNSYWRSLICRRNFCFISISRSVSSSATNILAINLSFSVFLLKE